MVTVDGPAAAADSPRPRLRHRRLPARSVGAHEATSARRGPAACRRRCARDFSGVDIVPEVVRLCAMNLYLHGIGDDESPIERADALISLGCNALRRGADQSAVRPQAGLQDRRRRRRDRDRARGIQPARLHQVTTSNKQLNFLQHIMSMLSGERRGRGGAARQRAVRGRRGREIRKRLLDNYDFHTLLRLPTGIFYKQGVKANVLFFDRKPARRRRGRKSSGFTTSAPTRASR